MTAIVCVDRNNGTMFNHRRQSQDRAVRARIAEETRGARLFMSPYSALQFRNGLPGNAAVSENFLDEAGADDYCFVEDADLRPYLDRVDELILYRWNRVYPADRELPADLHAWDLTYAEDFPGFSHGDITEERYMPAYAGGKEASRPSGKGGARA